MINGYTFNQIRELLDRYYMGETSVEEEKVLNQVFSDSSLDIPADMQADVELFRQMNGIRVEVENYLDHEAEIHLPLGFEQRLQATLNQLSQTAEGEAKNTESYTIGSSEVVEQPPRIGFYLRRAAACVAVVVLLGIGYMNYEQPVYTDTCKSPEEAAMQMNRALALLSSKSQQGVEQAFQSLDNNHQAAVPTTSNLNKFISFN